MELNEELLKFLQNKTKFTFDELITSQKLSVDDGFRLVKRLINEDLIEIQDNIITSKQDEINKIYEKPLADDDFSPTRIEYLGKCLTTEEINVLERILESSNSQKLDEISKFDTAKDPIEVMNTLYQLRLVKFENDYFYAVCNVAQFKAITDVCKERFKVIKRHFNENIRDKVEDLLFVYDYYVEFLYVFFKSVGKCKWPKLDIEVFKKQASTLKTEKEYRALIEKLDEIPQIADKMFLTYARIVRSGLERFRNSDTVLITLVNKARKEFQVEVSPNDTLSEVLLKAVELGATKEFLLPDGVIEGDDLKQFVIENYLFCGCYKREKQINFPDYRKLVDILDCQAGRDAYDGKKVKIFFRFNFS